MSSPVTDRLNRRWVGKSPLWITQLLCVCECMCERERECESECEWVCVRVCVCVFECVFACVPTESLHKCYGWHNIDRESSGWNPLYKLNTPLWLSQLHHTTHTHTHTVFLKHTGTNIFRVYTGRPLCQIAGSSSVRLDVFWRGLLPDFVLMLFHTVSDGLNTHRVLLNTPNLPGLCCRCPKSMEYSSPFVRWLYIQVSPHCTVYLTLCQKWSITLSNNYECYVSSIIDRKSESMFWCLDMDAVSIIVCLPINSFSIHGQKKESSWDKNRLGTSFEHFIKFCDTSLS